MPITITVDPPTGNITVDPSIAYFLKGAVVQWQLTNSPTSLTVSFKAGTPFNAQQLRGSTGSVESGILMDAATGVYHYAVSALVGDKIYAIPGCPEIVVG